MSKNLTNQFFIYSVDTSAFYTDEEDMLQQQLYDLFNKRKSKSEEDSVADEVNEDETYKDINLLIREKKLELKQKISSYSGQRTLRNDHLIDKNVISLFESSLSRTLKIDKEMVSTNLLVVQTYYFPILENIIKDGFLYNNENYILFTASAGQIREKKAIFIKESVWEAYKNTLMCGLTIESINKQGGMNVNKLLAYLALFNSATEVWEGFDINKCIVVDDMETNVNGSVDYIDNKTFKIERKNMDVPINHTDGCGMMLPSVSKKPFMVRLPWVKGLLVPFNFRHKKWIRKERNSVFAVDIDGKQWDLIKDDIQIIFTKSQFKMHSYYQNWQEYKDNFIKYNCQAGICNEEEDEIKDSKLNYQMLQTLTDITDDELKQVVTSTNEIINQIGRDKDTMLKVLGVNKSKNKKNYFQKALSIYPELLMDSYTRDILKETKGSIVKNARAGKIRVEGKYTFVIPDLYAYCEWLLLGEDKPFGLLSNGEVYCSLYDNEQKLDVLRSPHLYKEHCVRLNIMDDEKKKWFICKGVYTSTHDLISKVLQFDVDGDKSLVVVDPVIVSVAERNMEGIVPLYYQMSVAKKEQINSDSIYASLTAAYKANIGEISNKITKIFNSEKEIDLDVVKWLCFINNEIIDYAKTLHKSVQPKHVKDAISKATKGKVPQFFIYAKKKEEHEVEPINNSVVNRLMNVISNKNVSFLDLKGSFDYKLLMSNKRTVLGDETISIIEAYDKLNKNKKWIMKEAKKADKNVKYEYVWKHIRDELLKINNDVTHVTDVLVKLLYDIRDTPTKETLWKCFGDIILSNLDRNVKGTMQCEECGTRIKKNNNKQKLCTKCSEVRNKNNKSKWKEKNRNVD